jgi:hypothetical protein
MNHEFYCGKCPNECEVGQVRMENGKILGRFGCRCDRWTDEIPHDLDARVGNFTKTLSELESSGFIAFDGDSTVLTMVGKKLAEFIGSKHI